MLPIAFQSLVLVTECEALLSHMRRVGRRAGLPTNQGVAERLPNPREYLCQNRVGDGVGRSSPSRQRRCGQPMRH